MKQFQKVALALVMVLVSGVVLMACGPDNVGKRLTVENYNAIELTTPATATEDEIEGSTFEEVKELLGTPTGDKKELTDTDADDFDDEGFDGDMLEWSNKKGDKQITVTFMNGRAIEKSQKGILESDEN